MPPARRAAKTPNNNEQRRAAPAPPRPPDKPDSPAHNPGTASTRDPKKKGARDPKKATRDPKKDARGRKATGAREAKATDAREAKATNAREVKPTTDGAETTVVIVGAGRLGSALARALDSAGGYRVSALVSRRRARALRAARRLRPGALALSADELRRIPASDLLIIATPDDQIAPTAARLAAATQARAVASSVAARPAVALHASGALSSDALSPLRARGFPVGSLHPLVSVADADSAARAWRGAFFCVEGDAPALRAARRIVRALGGRAFSVRAEDKALYHASAVLASGHAVALFDLACETLAACGLTPKDARRVLLPLARSTLANLAAAPANPAALTGPFARADAETVRRHLAAFDARALEAARRLYARLGRRSLALAAAAGADPSALAEIARALSSADGAD